MKIIHLRHKDIDKEKWDKVVEDSAIGLPYCFTWYLDTVSPNWEALVSDDYDFIMPLPLKKKCGINYLFQPQWTQQLGILAKNSNLNQDITNKFIAKIPYLFYCFNINYTNNIKKITPKNNLTLNLDCGVETIRRGYNQNTKRNIRKAQSYNLNIGKLSSNEVFEFYCMENNDVVGTKFHNLQTLMATADINGVGRGYGVWDNDTLIAALFGIETKQRFIYLNPISSKQGKDKSAMFLLVDKLIEVYSKKRFIFDFEGSMIPGVEKFYLGFGAKVEQYGELSRMKTGKILSLLIKMRDNI